MIVGQEKPPLAGVYIAHFGTRGMKWGVRKGKSSTGVSRHRGAIIDRNARTRKRLTDARAGTGPRSYRASVAIGRTLLGKKRWERQFQKSMKSLNDQDSRLRKGKLTINDRLNLTLTVAPNELFLSRRPS